MSYERRAFLAAAGASLLTAGCGFTPLYGEGSPARAAQGRIAVDQIGGRIGFELKKRLTSRLGAPKNVSHRLGVQVSVSAAALAISDVNEITRYSLTGTANYALRDARGGTQVSTGSVRAFASYSATASTFATSSASVDAHERLAHSLAEQIATRLASSAGDWLT